MKPSVAYVNDRICGLRQLGGRAAEDFPRGQGFALWHDHFIVPLELLRYALQGRDELNGSDQGQRRAAFEVMPQGIDHVLTVDLDVDEDVKHFDERGVDGHEAAVPVVDHVVGAQSPRREVVDTASAVRDVTHDERLGARKLLYDVGDGTGEHEKAFGKLERHTLGASLSHPPHCLVQLEVVVPWEGADTRVQLVVVEYLLRDVTGHSVRRGRSLTSVSQLVASLALRPDKPFSCPLRR